MAIMETGEYVRIGEKYDVIKHEIGLTNSDISKKSIFVALSVLATAVSCSIIINPETEPFVRAVSVALAGLNSFTAGKNIASLFDSVRIRLGLQQWLNDAKEDLAEIESENEESRGISR